MQKLIDQVAKMFAGAALLFGGLSFLFATAGTDSETIACALLGMISLGLSWGIGSIKVGNRSLKR